MGGSSAPEGVGWLTGFFVGPLVLFLLVFGLGFVLLAGLVYAGLCALAGAVLLYSASRLVGGGKLSWADAYRPVFFGYLVALLVDGIRTRIVTGSVLGSMRSMSPMEEVTTFADAFALPLVASLMDWLWPGVPVAMVLLAVQSPAYRGVGGVARSAVLSSIALPGSLLVPLGLLLALDQRLGNVSGVGDALARVLALLVAVALYAVVGSLLAAPLLRRALVEFRPPGAGLLRRTHSVAILVLAVWASVTYLVMFFVPLFDPWWGRMVEAAAGGPLPTGLFTHPGAVVAGLMTFALLGAPGVWAGARVGRRLLGPSGGSLSQRQTLGVTAAVVVTTWPLLLACAWILALVSR